MANTGEYSWRYWKITDCYGKSMILDFNEDSTWLTSNVVNRVNDGDRLATLFNNNTLTDGSLIKLPKSNNCYKVYHVDKSEIPNIENNQRYGEYMSSVMVWENPAEPFNNYTLTFAFDQLPDNSVVVCVNIGISQYQICECDDPGNYNSIELIDLCGGTVRFVKSDSFKDVIGFEFGNDYYITCFDVPSVYHVVGYSTHDVDSDYPVVYPQCVFDVNPDGIEDLCGDKYHFKGCDGNDVYAVYIDTDIELEAGKYYIINDGNGNNCCKYLGKDPGTFTHELITVIDGKFIDCGCMMSWNGKFESCDGEHVIVINVLNAFREQLVEDEYYTIGDSAVVRIGGSLVKNCFRFIGYTNDEINSTILMNKLKECDPNNCSSMYVLARIISCIEGYEEKVWVVSEVLNILHGLESNTFTYNGHRCCYFEYDMETATSEEPIGGTIVTMEDISDITTDCIECKNDLIDSGLATCLVIHPCDCDKDYYISLQDMDSDEINKLIEHLSGKYVSFMALGKRMCGLVETDCSSVTNGLDQLLVIEPDNITGCYFSCDECYNADTNTPVPVCEQVTGRIVEPGYNTNDPYHCVHYESCCCDNEDINDENLNL